MAENREEHEDLGDFVPNEQLGPDDLDVDDEDLDLDDDEDLDDLESDDYLILDDEDLDLKEAFGLPDQLPPVRLPAEQELAAMSRAAPLLGQARRLAEWVAPGRDITEEAELTAADTVAAARELGIAVPVEADTSLETLPGMPGPPAVASMQDVPELARLWEIAFDAGFLELDLEGERMEPGADVSGWPDGTDVEVLDIWSTTLPAVLSRLEDDADLDESLSEFLDFTDAGWALMVSLFLAGDEGVPVREASDVISQAATDELEAEQADEVLQAWTQAHGDPAEYLLDMLQELGAVTLSDEPPSEAGPVARLTPLGAWAMRELLIEDGVEIPLLPPKQD